MCGRNGNRRRWGLTDLQRPGGAMLEVSLLASQPVWFRRSRETTEKAHFQFVDLFGVDFAELLRYVRG